MRIQSAVDNCLLIFFLRDPEICRSFSLEHWDLLVRQARLCRMLGRLYYLVADKQLMDQVPGVVLKHLRWGRIVADRHKDMILRELATIQQALRPLGDPVVVLKGAAYAGSGLLAGSGRFFSDIDILLPKNSLADAEALLQRDGWITTHHDSYDQRYYRKWMHELPPMRHGQRRTELDVHHNILPETAVITLDAGELLSTIAPLGDRTGLWRLSDEDIVLHSASHLFFDGEFTVAIRDLYDINSLIVELIVPRNGWHELVNRGLSLNLHYPLYLALFYCKSWFSLPVPDEVLKCLCDPCEISGAGWRLRHWMFKRGLLPNHESCRLPLTGIAKLALFIRAHYLRLPMGLLIPHLAYKLVVPNLMGLIKPRRRTASVEELVAAIAQGKR